LPWWPFIKLPKRARAEWRATPSASELLKSTAGCLLFEKPTR
jgi:hypothetical protein